MVAVENGAGVHNLVVCTLCSCYPWPVLGLPPVWYKSPPYRSRAVLEPRAVLEEFGVTLPSDTEIRVWDSTAETRYLVIPERPPGTEGFERGAARRRLVTRDSMIGTGLALAPVAMNGAQDLGGMMGFGPIAPEPNEPVFHARMGEAGAGRDARRRRLRSLDDRRGRYARESSAAGGISLQELLRHLDLPASKSCSSRMASSPPKSWRPAAPRRRRAPFPTS